MTEKNEQKRILIIIGLVTTVGGGIVVTALSPLGEVIGDSLFPPVSSVLGTIRQGDQPIRDAIIVLDNASKASTEGDGAFIFQRVNVGIHWYKVFEKGDSLLYYSHFAIDRRDRIKDLGVVNLSGSPNPSLISDPNLANDAFIPEVSGVTYFPSSESLPGRPTSSHISNQTESEDRFYLSNEVSESYLDSTPIENSAIPIVRPLEIEYHVTRVNESVNDTKSTTYMNTHNITVWVSGNDRTILSVDRVTYYLHPSFNPSVV